MKKTVSLIVALDASGQLLSAEAFVRFGWVWHLPFGAAIIVDWDLLDAIREKFIPNMLVPGNLIVVLSPPNGKRAREGQDFWVARGPRTAIEFADDHSIGSEIFVAGSNAEVYERLLPFADRLYLIHTAGIASVRIPLPSWRLDEWRVTNAKPTIVLEASEVCAVFKRTKDSYGSVSPDL